MNTNLPISQADLEAMRIGSVHAAAEREWSWMMTVDAVSGNLQASTDFRRTLVKAGLLQDNSNIQPPMVWAPILYSYDFLFPPKETKMARQKTLEINSLPMPLCPEIKDFRDRLRQKLREMEAQKREMAR